VVDAVEESLAERLISAVDLVQRVDLPRRDAGLGEPGLPVFRRAD